VSVAPTWSWTSTRRLCVAVDCGALYFVASFCFILLVELIESRWSACFVHALCVFFTDGKGPGACWLDTWHTIILYRAGLKLGQHWTVVARCWFGQHETQGALFCLNSKLLRHAAAVLDRMSIMSLIHHCPSLRFAFFCCPTACHTWIAAQRHQVEQTRDQS
jgi:hypothetical protein